MLIIKTGWKIKKMVFFLRHLCMVVNLLVFDYNDLNANVTVLPNSDIFINRKEALHQTPLVKT